jgi:hypothetical protein
VSSKIVFVCDRCRTEIKEHQRPLAVIGGTLGLTIAFGIWNEENPRNQSPFREVAAKVTASDTALHFCGDECAKSYFANWLMNQRGTVIDAEFRDVDEPPAPAPAPEAPPRVASNEPDIDMPF